MAKAFKKSYSVSMGPTASDLLNMNDGWQEGSGTMSYKQKLVEIPRIEEIAFHCSTHCTLLMGEISQYTIIILEVLPQSYIRKGEPVFIQRKLQTRL